MGKLRVLPRLEPHLPVAVPEPVARGEPGDGYPFTWDVYRWLLGEPPRKASVGLARDVASCLHALQQVPVEDEGPVNSRGAPLARRDRAFRESLACLGDEVDRAAVTPAWDDSLAAPEWSAEPVLIHGDMLPANLLLRDGRLSAVLDWGIFGAGDPACDYLIALGYYLHTNPPMVAHARSAIGGVLADADG